jgi:phage anti-repressor protein
MVAPKLTENIVFDLINSVIEFPVDFDLAYKWLEFTRKDNAKRSLIESGFVEGIDFCYSLPNEGIETIGMKIPKSINKKAGETRKIWLTTECFKTWAMMAATQKGKEVRKYFLECERKLKQIAAAPAKTDWVLADLMEHDMLASAVAALSQLFLSLAKEQGQQKNFSGNINYADMAHILCVAAHTIQTPPPDYDEEALSFPPEVEFDNQRWCLMLRDAFAVLSPTQAAKWLAEVAEKNPDAGYFRSFPPSIAIPGYQRGDDRILGNTLYTPTSINFSRF